MHINTNSSAMTAYRMSSMSTTEVNKNPQTLSSGMRMNSAADDAAVLAISEKTRAQLLSPSQAERNIQDAISHVQVADAAMTEVHSLLQRGRELAVQAASDALTLSEKQKLQDETVQITEEIDRITNTAQHNSKNLFNTGIDSRMDEIQVMSGLKMSWLQQAEALVHNYYGLTADNAPLAIVLETTPQPYIAAVSFEIDATGKAANQILHIDMEDFTPATWPNGGTPPLYNDRIIAHEMVHAVMGRTMNFASLPIWFQEGTAEFITGADERLRIDSENGTDLAGVVSDFDNGWQGGNSRDYSAAYAAVRYMHQAIKDAGGSGIRDVFDCLSTYQSATLDDVLAAIQWAHPSLEFNSVESFATAFSINGAAYIATLDLSNDDTGAIGGADADGGPIRTAVDVVPDNINLTNDPLTGFTELWPAIEFTADPLPLQAGANSGQYLGIILPKTDSAGIDLRGINLVTKPQAAISQFDAALEFVSAERAKYEATQSHLHDTLHSMMNDEKNSASTSRIRDLDYAKEILSSTREDILSQTATAIQAQAKQLPQYALELLSA